MTAAPCCNACGARFEQVDQFCADCGAGRASIVIDTSRVGGLIGTACLAEWWLTRLTDDERRRVNEKYYPLTTDQHAEDIDRGAWDVSGNRAANIMAVAGWLGPIGAGFQRELLECALPLATDVQDRHFILSSLIDVYRGDWKTEPNLVAHEQACWDQIAISSRVAKAMRREFPDFPLPSHSGFHELTALLRRRGDDREADRIQARAVKQGWAE